MSFARSTRLAVYERGFCRFAVGDIDVHAAVAHWRSAHIADHATTSEDPSELAVGADDAVLALVVADALTQ